MTTYPTNEFKTPLARSLNQAAQRVIAAALDAHGKVLPVKVESVSGSIVTVSFEVTSSVFTLPKVTCPQAYPEYIRLPIQRGDKGIVIPAGVSLGNASGLGTGGVPPYEDISATLSDVLFLPLAATTYSETDDPDALVLYGPNGVVLRDADSNCKIVINKTAIIVTGATEFKSNVTMDENLSVKKNSSFGGGTLAVVLNGAAVIGGVVRANSKTMMGS